MNLKKWISSLGKEKIDYQSILKNTQHNYTTMYWGHNIEFGTDIPYSFIDKKTGEVINLYKYVNSCIFSFTRLSNNDLVIMKMKSGKLGIFVIQNLRSVGDPNDMYWCDLLHIGRFDDPES